MAANSVGSSGSSGVAGDVSVPKVFLNFETVSGINTGNAVAQWANPENELVSHIDSYKVHWYYRNLSKRADGSWVWFDGGESNVAVGIRNSVYSIPSEAYQIKVSVAPVPKTHKVKVTTGKGKNKSTKEVDRKWFTGKNRWGFLTTKEENFTPDTPSSAPSLTLKPDGTFRAEVSGLSEYATHATIQFERPAQNGVVSGVTTFDDLPLDVNKSAAAERFPKYAGYTMRVRAKAINLSPSVGRLESEWSVWSGEKVSTPPPIPAPRAIISDEHNSIMRVEVPWVYGVDTYTLQYTDREGVWSGDSVQEKPIQKDFRVIEFSVDSGKSYWIRAKGANTLYGGSVEGPYGPATKVIIGKKPQPPTTWSDRTTTKLGIPVIFYWVHNTVDGSAQTLAQVEINANGETRIIDVPPVVDSSTGENSNKGEYSLDTNSYSDQTKIRWRVRTRGISDKWSDWSIQREVSLYIPPTLTVNTYQNVDGGSPVDVINSFPFYIRAEASPLTQKAMGFYISITSKSTYDYVASDGTDQTVGAGQEIYSEFFDFSSLDNVVNFGDYATVSNNIITVKLTPDRLDLEPGTGYTVNMSVSMNTGLSASAVDSFSVEWDEEYRYPKCEFLYDPNAVQMLITPFCIDEVTETQEYVYSKDVTLSVYRREHNGELKLVASNIVNDGKTAVLDPHPSLKEAFYRIIAVSTKTGSISRADPSGYPIGETDIIIQWDEDWYDLESFDPELTGDIDYGSEPAWSGSMLRLPYNIDTSESTSPDVALIKPIGRKRPVSHYGTQLSETATWNTEFPKSDTDTINLLRRLQTWPGDVYVREPSGTGYWANVTVSFNLTHCELTVPVTINVTRVEGGL